METADPVTDRHDGKFAARIKRLRMTQGRSQRQVAELAHVSIRTYREWEAGRAVPYPGTNLESIAYVLRAEPLFLLFGEQEGHAFD